MRSFGRLGPGAHEGEHGHEHEEGPRDHHPEGEVDGDSEDQEGAHEDGDPSQGGRRHSRTGATALLGPGGLEDGVDGVLEVWVGLLHSLRYTPSSPA